ncbi:MAG: hypothetical protein ACI9LG_002099 [Moritella dasanensis]|jgi:hypothetical protein
MKIILNIGIWLAVASLFGGVVGLVVSFSLLDSSSTVMTTFNQVWLDRGWLLPYTSVASIVFFIAFSLGSAKEDSGGK